MRYSRFSTVANIVNLWWFNVSIISPIQSIVDVLLLHLVRIIVLSCENSCLLGATAGRDCPGARSAMADTSMIPSPSRPAAHTAGSHPWATSSPSVETRVLSTSDAALSHRARDLTMVVSSHRLCFKLQQLASSAPRRILPTFLTRRSVLTHVWGCMMHTHNTSNWLPSNMHIARLFLLFLPTCAYSLHCDRRKRCVLKFDPHTFS